MAGTQPLSRSQIRNLIVGFYASVDPARLDSGIDINGIVTWCEHYGVQDMDARLKAKYGVGLDYSILKKGNDVSAMQRISMMPNARQQEDHVKRVQIAQRLQKFYETYDPSKLDQIDNFVDWILYHGEGKFNDLVRAKYGADLTTGSQQSAPQTENKPPTLASKPTPPKVPTSAAKKPPPPAASKPPPQGSSKPPPPVAPKKPDPPKMPTPSKPPPPVAPKKPDPPKMPAPSKPPTPAKQVTPPAAPKKPDPPQKPAAPVKPTPPQKPAAPVKPEPPSILTQAPKGSASDIQKRLEKFYSIHEPEKIGHIKPIVDWAVQVGEDTLNEKLMQLYGADLNDMKESEAQPPPPPELMSTTKNTAPSAPSSSFTASNTAKPAVSKPVVPPKKPKPPAWMKDTTPIANDTRRKRSPDEGACDNYKLDMTGETFGVCVCGFNRAAHTEKKAQPRVRSIKMAQSAASKEKAAQPCNSYVLDMQATQFGACKCGWPKADHGKPVAPVVQQTPKEKPQETPLRRASRRLSSITKFAMPSKSETPKESPKSEDPPPPKPERKEPPLPPRKSKARIETPAELEESSPSPSFRNSLEPDLDVPPPPPPPDLDEDVPPPPPIEESPDAQAMSTVLGFMEKSYFESTGEAPSTALKQEWVGELIRAGGAKTNQLHEVGKQTAHMSITSRLKARAAAVGGKSGKKFD